MTVPSVLRHNSPGENSWGLAMAMIPLQMMNADRHKALRIQMLFFILIQFHCSELKRQSAATRPSNPLPKSQF
jgi:hypothetical protein